MIKKRSDFNSEDDYIKYTRSSEFLSAYELNGKEAEEIHYDMRFPESWLPYVKKALPTLIKQGQFKGIDLYFLVDDLLMQEEDYTVTETKM
ncbi:hypothetical protein AC623_11310 [Bacillus sp. FJAT-27231]|uniref:hypothetical protein n=1 Tax=Bacillus sp. FJAT-27231 TaxID=1679168 RepID=UPI0006714995|nr:hypothetical protein [Bacillus sp. FJAT-27231]KMY54425.1 hypothetical protein AC623_11310 [Bacillus sp. FJAT-27231]